MPKLSARLEAESITWGPQKGMPIISGITLSVEAGARLAIIGPNGAGKSTLLRCLYRGLKPQRGLVRLDGTDLWSIGPREAALRIAVVPQETPGDFPFSVRDVVLMGRIPHRKGMARWSDRDHDVTTKALARLELEPLALRQFASLSGGEKQRALIARALAQEPELIILDEPTNHLDIRHQLEILELLKGLGPTIITTLHDINLAADFATQIAVMDCGRLTGHGEPAEVLTAEHVSSAFRVGARLHRTDGGPQRFSFSLR
ncbi:ABC transporter ATP-binding protein [Rhizobium multihospitium]|uniref:Iron complex transport system ATP-binding protein n=1 Tax=Rhizobium multihospitium TaxID=410764 RepID=A0A1C3WS99_9HYPH|nr:ABC transporter ATP-binding protein [Rhizobium multihospitium]SCB42839.1 iron complex transport system ATP-binding protein [Rhizobium multihospitium]